MDNKDRQRRIDEYVKKNWAIYGYTDRHCPFIATTQLVNGNPDDKFKCDQCDGDMMFDSQAIGNEVEGGCLGHIDFYVCDKNQCHYKFVNFKELEE